MKFLLVFNLKLILKSFKMTKTLKYHLALHNILLKYASCLFNYKQGLVIGFPTHLPPNGYKQQLEWSVCVCVCVLDLAVNSSCECFSLALDSSFLKGLSGRSGLIVLGQANWPRLAARLSETACCPMDFASAVGHFTRKLCILDQQACWTAVDLRREKIWKRLFSFWKNPPRPLLFN